MRVVRRLARWGLVFLTHAGLAHCPVPGGWMLGAPPVDGTSAEPSPLSYEEWRRWRRLERQLKR
ncbi:MAG TPA: hypothetical protein VH333_01165 [Pseudonocardiaceae bacterium]|jgi:hypothetical protein|nr:hypothetical protein [Pseudonocardiaceae bacterium]